MKKIVLNSVMLVGVSAVVGCSVSQEQELQLGKENHGTFEKQSGGLYPDQAVSAYVNNVGMQMARLAGRPEMNWQFHVVNASDINAFAVPGGYIYITQGLLFKLQNEAQLAGVLGHEAGHIAGRHSARQMERAQTIGVLTAGVGVVAEQAGYAAVGELGSAASQMYLLKYGRDQETEADYLGLGYMTQVGYNPEGMVSVMKLLKQVSGGKSGGRMAEWTSSHPDPGNRAEYLEEEIQKKYQQAKANGRFGQPEFQANVLNRRRGAASVWPAFQSTEEAIAAGVPGVTVEMWRRGEVCAILGKGPGTMPAIAPAMMPTSRVASAVTTTTRSSVSSLHAAILDGCLRCQEALLEARQKGVRADGELMKVTGVEEEEKTEATPAWQTWGEKK